MRQAADKRVSAKMGEPRTGMAAMIQKLKTDRFAKIYAAIDQMVTDLDAEMAAEVKQKDFCNTAFNENESTHQVRTTTVTLCIQVNGSEQK